MSFNLYFAGWGSRSADEYLREIKANRLLSQVNERRVIEWWVNDNVDNKLFIDSGAFSVAHSGAEVDIDEYIAFINSHPNIPVFAELDVIPFPVLNNETAKYCSDASWDNYLYMKSRITTNCSLLPLYHFGEPIEGLKRILNTKVDGKLVDYIGIGGRHGVSTDAQCKYFESVFSIIKSSDNPNVKVHAFGITVPKILTSFPFYSADSTTWLQVAINGGILRSDLSNVTISNNTKSDFKNIQAMHSDITEVIKQEVMNNGYDWETLCEDYTVRLRYNIDVMRKWAKDYTYRKDRSFKESKLF